MPPDNSANAVINALIKTPTPNRRKWWDILQNLLNWVIAKIRANWAKSLLIIFIVCVVLGLWIAQQDEDQRDLKYWYVMSENKTVILMHLSNNKK